MIENDIWKNALLKLHWWKQIITSTPEFAKYAESLVWLLNDNNWLLMMSEKAKSELVEMLSTAYNEYEKEKWKTKAAEWTLLMHCIEKHMNSIDSIFFKDNKATTNGHQQDTELTKKMPLSMRVQNGITIINLEGFWEFASTVQANLSQRSCTDKENEPIKLDQISKSWPKNITERISWTSINTMSVERVYELMNILAQYLKIPVTINDNYMKNVFAELKDKPLPKDHNLMRIVINLSAILHDYFIIPLFIDKGKYRSDLKWIYCYYEDKGMHKVQWQGWWYNHHEKEKHLWIFPEPKNTYQSEFYPLVEIGDTLSL